MSQFDTLEMKIKEDSTSIITLDTLTSSVGIRETRRVSQKAKITFQVPVEDAEHLQRDRFFQIDTYGGPDGTQLGRVKGYIKEVDLSLTPTTGNVKVTAVGTMDEMDRDEVEYIEITEPEVVSALHAELHSPEFGSLVLEEATDGDPNTTAVFKIHSWEDRGNGRYLLYIMSDGPFNRIYLGVYSVGAQGATLTWYVEPFTGDGWPGIGLNEDQTMDNGRPFYKPGWISYDQNPTEQPTTHEGIYGYWMRILVHDTTETFDLNDIQVEQAGPHGAAAQMILSQHSTWQLETGSLAGPTLPHVIAAYGATVFGMLTDLCERSHSAFIKGSEQRVIFLTEPISNDLYAKAQLEPDDDPDKTLVLTKMSRKQENSRIVTRITPYGAGSDKLAAPTIRACPTDIDAELFAEGFTLDRDENMVINYALESQLGYQVHETVPFPHVHQLRGGTGPNRITARELAQVAKSWLLEHNREEYFIYTAECLNWNEAEFGLARSCRVQYDLTRNDGTVYESIDEDLVIAEVTWEPDNEGTNIYSIKFSRNLAPIPTEEYRDAQATRNDRRRAMHPQPISKYTVVGGVDAVGAAATPAGGSGSVSGDLAKHIAENVDAHLIPEQIDAKIETHDALETAHNIPGQIADHAADPDSHHSQLHSVGDPVHHDAGTLMPWDWLSKAGSSLAHLASRLISDTTGSLLWGRVDKTGSQLSDLQSRPHSSLTSVSEDQHHSRQHSVTDANDHAMGGADGDVLMRIAGAPGLHTPSADVRGTAVEKLIKSTAEGESALEKLVATLAEISAFQSHLIPDETDTYDIGSVIKLWRQAFISELNAVLFVENSASAIGGWFIIPHGQGTLGEDVSDSETAIDFGGHLVEVGDFILLRGVGAGGPQVEYMRIDSLSGGNVWNVTRNLDGTGANEWPEGHVFIVLGQTGDGRIELDAQNGGPRISMITQGAAYNAQTEIVRVGDLNNWGPFVAETYGWSVGDYTSGNYAYYDGTKLEVRGLLKILGDSSFDGVVSISAAGEIRQGVGTVGADFTGLRIRHDGTQGIGLIELYLDGNIQVQTDTQGRLLAGGGLVVLDEDGLTITSAGTVWQNLGTPLEGASQAQTNATKLRFLDLIGNSNAEIFAESRSEYNYGSDLPIASKADLTLVARFIDNGNGTIYQVPLGPNIKLITEDETGYEYAAIEVSGDDAAGRIKMRLADGVQFFYADGLFSSLTERGRVFWNSDTEHTGKLTIKHEGESLVIQHVDDSGITARNWLSFKLANGTRIGYLGNGSSSGTSMYLLADAGNALYLGGNGNVRAMVYNGLAVGLTNDPGAGAIHAKNILKVGDGTGSPSLTIDKDDTGLGGIYFQNEGVNQLILRLDSSEDLEFNTRNNDGSYRTVLMKLYRESDFVFIRDLLVGNPGPRKGLGAIHSETAYVGDVQSGWSGASSDWVTVTLLNSWANFGTGYADAAYRLLPNGKVILRGLIKNGSVSATAFILPAGLVPTGGREIFSCISNTAIGRIDIDGAGKVWIMPPCNNAWVSLSGIEFFCK